jgi:methylmalonyl-CoA/ethylmalonyl-CoA epimerase
MRPTHIEHIGIAVKSLVEAIPVYERLLGTPCYRIEEVPDQEVRTAFFKVGTTKIELLETIAAQGPIGKYIEKRGEGIHHLALAVPEVSDALRDLEAAGVALIDQEPRQGADALAIAFVHPRSTHGVLLELCQSSRPEEE